MGSLFFYKDYQHSLGDVAAGRWRQMRKLLPALVEYLNESMAVDWDSGTRLNVAVSEAGASPGLPGPRTPPRIGPFALDRLLRDESQTRHEIYIEDADEFMRLLDWHAFLQDRDGAASLYEPLVSELRARTRGIEVFASAGRAG